MSTACPGSLARHHPHPASRGAGRAAAPAPRRSPGATGAGRRSAAAPPAGRRRGPRACGRGRGPRPPGRGPGIAPGRAHEGDGAAREVEGVAARVGHDLDHRRAQHLLDRAQGRGEGGRDSVLVLLHRADGGVDALGIEEGLVALHVHHEVGVAQAARDLGQTIRPARWSAEVMTASPPKARTAAAMRSSSVATSTRSGVGRAARARAPAGSSVCHGDRREASPADVLKKSAPG